MKNLQKNSKLLATSLKNRLSLPHQSCIALIKAHLHSDPCDELRWAPNTFTREFRKLLERCIWSVRWISRQNKRGHPHLVIYKQNKALIPFVLKIRKRNANHTYSAII